MKRTITAYLFALIAIVASAAVLDDVKTLIDNGDYEAAMSAVEPLRKKSPRDAKINYWYGKAALGLGRMEDAENALTVAAERGHTDAYADLIDIELNRYAVDDARDNIDSWRAALKKARKSEPAELAAAEARMVLMANQLDRVENIPVIARYDISRDEFDKVIEALSQPGAPHGTSFIGDAKIPFFINNSGREVFWTAPDSEGVNRLYTAGVLDDGTREEAVELTEYVGEGDIMAPFMLEDGETLYFAASRDDDGLGGYDIYMTRRDGEGGFYEPTNIGMPYNSTGDDLLFVIDEANNVGWWATDRFSTEGDSVAILAFVPAKTRTNVSTDDPNLAERALVTDISLTIPDGFDLNAAKARIPRPSMAAAQSADGESITLLSLGNGRIISKMSDFSNPQAADEMEAVLNARAELAAAEKRLADMRSAYAAGNTDLKGDIRALEAETERMQRDLTTQTNRVIRLETTR